MNVKEAIIVEGRYDANSLAQIIDATIVEVNGFSIFTDDEKIEYIKMLAKTCGIIVFTDSDTAGFKIRTFINDIANGGNVKNAYAPEIMGKERRKSTFSKEKMLGVEGLDKATLIKALSNAGATVDDEQPQALAGDISRNILYEGGFSGAAGSAFRLKVLLRTLNLPIKLSKNGLVKALNQSVSAKEFQAALQQKPTLFFDFHGTLVQADNIWIDGAMRALARYAPTLKVEEQQVMELLYGRCLPWFTHEDRDTRSLIFDGEGWWPHSIKNFVSMFVQLGASAKSAELMAEALKQHILNPETHILFNDTANTLAELKARGYAMYLLSNNFPELGDIMRALGLDGFFEQQVVSGLIGYDKPRKEIFDHTRELAGGPRTCVMIGDNPKDDIEGAKSAGFLTIIVNSERPAPFADARAKNLSALLDIFI